STVIYRSFLIFHFLIKMGIHHPHFQTYIRAGFQAMPAFSFLISSLMIVSARSGTTSQTIRSMTSRDTLERSSLSCASSSESWAGAAASRAGAATGATGAAANEGSGISATACTGGGISAAGETTGGASSKLIVEKSSSRDTGALSTFWAGAGSKSEKDISSSPTGSKPVEVGTGSGSCSSIASSSRTNSSSTGACTAAGGAASKEKMSSSGAAWTGGGDRTAGVSNVSISKAPHISSSEVTFTGATVGAAATGDVTSNTGSGTGSAAGSSKPVAQTSSIDGAGGAGATAGGATGAAGVCSGMDGADNAEADALCAVSAIILFVASIRVCDSKGLVMNSSAPLCLFFSSSTTSKAP